MATSIKLKGKLIALNQEPVYPGPEVDPSTVDWMNLPTRWVATFLLKYEGDYTSRIYVPLDSSGDAEALSLNGSYAVSIEDA